jgi:hypothetical protein
MLRSYATTSELIAALQKYPPDTEVLLDDPVSGHLVMPIIQPLRDSDGAPAGVFLTVPSYVAAR